MEPYLGMIYMFAGNFAIQGYQMCNGQLLSISQNAALFSILGTTYGGNGTSTFQLPDLRGRVPIHMGNGPGLSPYVLGELSGAQNTTILISNLPAHTHTLNVNAAAGTTGTPGTTTYIAQGPSTGSGPNATLLKTFTTNAPNTTLAPNAIGLTGNTIPVSIIQPYLVLNFLIAMVGIFPSRN